MASPQKENGYTPIANEIMEALIKYPLPGSQMQCLLLILRKLYGYNKKHDAISYSQFEKYTNMKRRHVDRAIKELICKNVISVKKGITKLGNRTTTTYCFNKDYDTWGVLPKKVRGITKKCKRVLPKKVKTKDIIQKKEIYSRVINYLNKKTGKKFKATSKATQALINARLNESFKPEDFKTVIDNKCAKWLTDPKFIEYLRPATLFSNKFESYLNDIPPQDHKPTKEEILRKYSW